MPKFQPSVVSYAGFQDFGAVSLSSTVPIPGVAGVFMKKGVNLNDAMKGFLIKLRERLGFDLVVTSGIRTPWDQASALAQDYNFAVYGSSQGKKLVAEIKAGGLSVGQMAATIQRQVDKGLYLSRHMRGDALDFRVTGLTAGELAQLKATAASMGVEVVDEGDHIHVEELGPDWAQYVGYAAVGMGAFTLGVFGIGIIGAAIWYRRNRR